jgi:hypothetical protein
VLANKYQFFAFVEGGNNPREFGCGGVPMIPSFLSLTNAVWLTGNAQTDADATARSSFRSTPAGAYGSIHASICATTVIAQSSGHQYGCIKLNHMHDPGEQASVLYRWADDSLDVYDPVIGWGMAAYNTEAKKVGLLWDAFLCSGDFSVDTQVTFDGKNFWCITTGLTGTIRGSLFVYAP